MIIVLDPCFEADAERLVRAPGPGSLRGATVGILSNGKAGTKPFFAHLMTTSNHRPYTFPAGRGPWPQGKRESALAYTDWAIGDFPRRAENVGCRCVCE